MRMAAALAVLGVDVDRDEGRRLAARELAHPRYHRDDPTPLERARDWFFERLGKLVDGAIEVTPGGASGLAIIALLLLVSLVAFLVLRSVRSSASSGSAGDHVPGLLGLSDLTAAEHRRHATAAATEGRWSEAVLERFRALVRGLEERTVLDLGRGATADEAAAEAARRLPALADRLRAAAWEFDDVVFGERPADRSTYERMARLDDAAQRERVRFDPAGASSVAVSLPALPEIRG